MKEKERLLKNILNNTSSSYQLIWSPFTLEVFVPEPFMKGQKMSKNEKFQKCTKFISEFISGELVLHMCLPA